MIIEAYKAAAPGTRTDRGHKCLVCKEKIASESVPSRSYIATYLVLREGGKVYHSGHSMHTEAGLKEYPNELLVHIEMP